jgi:7-keto-8-aminopelargonate synthetase-like enzyme
LKSEPQRPKALLDIAQYVRTNLKEKGVKILENSIAPIIPIYTYTALRTLVACKVLYERGVYVNPVLPPATPEGECLIRTSYTATHSKALMDEAIATIVDVLSNLPDSEEALLSYMHNHHE